MGSTSLPPNHDGTSLDTLVRMDPATSKEILSAENCEESQSLTLLRDVNQHHHCGTQRGAPRKLNTDLHEVQSF